MIRQLSGIHGYSPLIKICRHCQSDLVLNDKKNESAVRCIRESCGVVDLPLLYKAKKCSNCGSIGMVLDREKDDRGYTTSYWRCLKCGSITAKKGSLSPGLH